MPVSWETFLMIIPMIIQGPIFEEDFHNFIVE